MKKRLIIAGVVLAVLIGGLSYFQFVFKPQMIKSFLSQMKPPPAAVAAEAVKEDAWIERLSSIGSLTASQGVDITTQVAGIVTGIFFDSGQELDQGAKLLDLDTSIEVADLASAKATLREAEVAFERQTDLIAKKVTSEANLDTARAKRDTAAAAQKKIEAVIAQKSIYAPFGGRLGIRKVEKGQYVSPGTSLVTLQALDPIRVDFPMPEQSIDKLRPGQVIEVTIDAYPGEVFKGELQVLDARVAQDTRTILVRGLLPNKDRKLLPGMFANVTVLIGSPKPVLSIPRTAVTYSLYGDSVYVVKPAKVDPNAKPAAPASGDKQEPQLVVERRAVKVGPVREDRVAVLSGLSAGEQVVTTGQLKLSPGAAVRVDNSQPLDRPAERPKL